MRYSSDWQDFQVVASGGGEKLEKWGNFYLLRPDPQAIWAPKFDFSTFRMLHGKYIRSQSGGGNWEFRKTLPDEWLVGYKNLKFIISPTSFKHTGLFPEQAVNWDKVTDVIKERIKNGEAPRVLNLFGYTGGATVAAAMAGATVTHVDASKGMMDVCRRNVELNNIPHDRVRYIVDDCTKFVAREIRREKQYDAIIMDPPSFGRGANGEVWKIEQHLDPLVELCCQVLSDKPLFFLVNSYTTGLQPTVIKNILKRNLDKIVRKKCTIDSYEIGVPTLEEIILPAGCSAFTEFK
ncbi:MAG: class I SAM-dependent methyltransferase [Firmicutes bacterium]|nr:class I SAM-dependent methyltransferase [Bacillota bacterium]